MEKHTSTTIKIQRAVKGLQTKWLVAKEVGMEVGDPEFLELLKGYQNMGWEVVLQMKIKIIDMSV